jgi:hypothetical protein
MQPTSTGAAKTSPGQPLTSPAAQARLAQAYRVRVASPAQHYCVLLCMQGSAEVRSTESPLAGLRMLNAPQHLGGTSLPHSPSFGVQLSSLLCDPPSTRFVHTTLAVKPRTRLTGTRSITGSCRRRGPEPRKRSLRLAQQQPSITRNLTSTTLLACLSKCIHYPHQHRRPIP